MPRESKAAKRERAAIVTRRIDSLYPAAEPALHFRDAFECVIAVSLSAQTTDARVNEVTPELFGAYGTPELMAEADPADVERIIHSVGFFRSKARNCIGAAQMILSEFGGEVPSTMEELQRLPGVGRKTANIVMNTCFGKCEGIAVDTHVFRIAHRLRLSSADDPSATERDLLELIDRDLWPRVNDEWIRFGRGVCTARSPKCAECPLADVCPSAPGC